MNTSATPPTLLDLFQRTASAQPDAPAVSDDERTLTYGQLDRRSEALAVTLLDHGVQPEDRVGLYTSRSVDVLVAILGILRAGAAYVAIDSRYPDARRDEMLAGSGAELVVTQPGWEQRLSGLNVQVLAFRSDETPAVRPCRARVEPDSAASVLFTSGSSGTPKAIVLEHRNIVAFSCNPSLPRLAPGDRTGQISSLSFDAFHFEMWTTLACGAEVVILPPVPELLAADFQREMKRRRISAMLVPTMVLNHVVHEDRNAFAPLRLLQAGGDVLLPSACRELLDSDFSGELYNLYGPAEITTACTVHRVSPQDAATDTIPIGRPVDGAAVFVLDEERDPVGPGVTGEVYVGGAGVARGYLGRDDLTGERFVPSPFPAVTGRLYRTGDLARRRADGVLEFMGRADDQIKVRGYRVEPGEVERALRRHPEVNDAAVLPVGVGDDRRLVAFVVAEDELTPKGLRAFAEAGLPDFMVPSQFTMLPVIPANEHGKRDRRALLEMLDLQQQRLDNHREPATPTERYLVQLWENLLATEGIGTNDDFFELGGHSLLAFRAQSRIKRDLGVSLDHRDILDLTVLSDLATAVDAARTGGA